MILQRLKIEQTLKWERRKRGEQRQQSVNEAILRLITLPSFMQCQCKRFRTYIF